MRGYGGGGALEGREWLRVREYRALLVFTYNL